MRAYETEFIILCARHELALINDKNDFGLEIMTPSCPYPSTQTPWHLGALDVGGRLRLPLSLAVAACTVGALLLREDGVDGGACELFAPA